jgi:uncharacterized protein YkwD
MVHSGRSSGPSEVPSSTSRRALDTPTKHTLRSSNAVQRAAVLVISVLVAVIAAVGASTADPAVAQAEDGGYVKSCGGGKIFLSATEKETFALHNQIRRDRGIRILCLHPKLQKAARAHSRDMIERIYFSHDTKGRNENFAERIKRYGYNYRKVGENIAWGSGSSGAPRSIMNAWMNSPDHRRNILNRDFRQIGIGVAHADTWQGYSDVNMYTADFGLPRG